MKAPFQTKAKNSSTALPSFTPVRSGLLQRKCACGGTPGPSGECESCRKKRLQRRASNSPAPSAITDHPSTVSEVPPIVHEVLRSAGQPLDPDTRAFMERRFGHDFSRVRVHADSQAGESARAVSALAYTVGSAMVFDAGQYIPTSITGRRLLAHELVHVIQGQNGAQPHRLTISQPTDAHEREADQMADAVLGSASAASSARRGMSQQTELEGSRFSPKSVSHGLSRQAGAIIREPRTNCPLPLGGAVPSCYACIDSATQAVVRTAVNRTPCGKIPKLSSCWEFIDGRAGPTTGQVVRLVYTDPKSGKAMCVHNMTSGSSSAYPDMDTALDFACRSAPP